MTDFFHNFFNVLFGLLFILIFFLAAMILKPFWFHRKRPYSTISLKVSYLVYLSSFLLFTYFLLFGQSYIMTGESTENIPVSVSLIMVVLTFIIPNTGILLRRRFHKERVTYNIFFTVLNILITIFLYYLLKANHWFMRI